MPWSMPLEHYTRLVEANPTDPTIREGLASAYRAADRYDEAIKVWEGLIRVDAGNDRYRRELADTLNSQGNSFEADRVQEALAAFRRSLSIVEQLERASPNDPEVLDSLGATLLNIGNILNRIGRDDEALEIDRRAVGYCRAAYDLRPNDYEFGHHLGHALASCGLTEFRLGRSEESLRSLELTYDMRARLAREHPALPNIYRDLYWTHMSKAQVFRSMGRHEEADREVLGARVVLESLPASRPGDLFNLACVRSMCSALETPGMATTQDKDEARRNADLAVEALRQAIAGGYANLDSIQGQKSLDPLRSRPDFRELVADLRRRQDIARLERRVEELKASGHPDGTTSDPAMEVRANREMLEAREALLATDPNNPVYRAGVAANLFAIGVIQTESDSLAEGIENLLKARAIRDELSRAEPTNPLRSADVAATDQALGLARIKAESWSEARIAFEHALEVRRSLAKAHPDDPTARDDLAIIEVRLGELYGRLSLWDEAVAHIQQGLALRPTVFSISMLNEVRCRVAGLQLALGDRRKFRENIESMIEMKKDVSINVTNSALIGIILEADCLAPIENGDDLAPLIRIIESKIAEPGEEHSWMRHTLGMLAYRSGRYEEAVTWFQKLPTGTRVQINLALAHHRLGHIEESLRWLEKADQSWDRWLLAALESPDKGVLAGHYHYAELAEALVLRREAEEVIHGRTLAPDPKLILLRARGFESLGLPERAAAELVELEMPEGDAQLHAIRGRIAVDLGLIDLAESDLALAIELRPYDPLPRATRARIRAAQGRSADAESDYAAAVGLDPYDGGSWKARADYFRGRGERDRAEADQSRAKAVEILGHVPAPDLSAALARLDAVATSQEDWIRDHPDDMRLSDDLALTYLLRAGLHHSLDRPEKTIEDARGTLVLWGLRSRSPLDAAWVGYGTSIAHKHLGAAAGKQGDWVESRKSLELASGTLDGMLKAHPEADRMGEELARVEIMLAEVYARFGLLEEPAALFRSSSLRRPFQDWVYWIRLTELLLAHGDADGYRQACERVIAEFPGPDHEAASLIVHACGFDPGSIDLEPYLDAAIARSATPSSEPFLRVIVCLGEYRVGRFADARARYDRITLPWLENSEWTALAALADRGLGKDEEARRELETFDRVWDGGMRELLEPSAFRPSWGDAYWNWSERILLRREANSVFERSPLEDEIQISLVQARGYAALGMNDRAVETFEALAIPASAIELLRRGPGSRPKPVVPTGGPGPGPRRKVRGPCRGSRNTCRTTRITHAPLIRNTDPEAMPRSFVAYWVSIASRCL